MTRAATIHTCDIIVVLVDEELDRFGGPNIQRLEWQMPERKVVSCRGIGQQFNHVNLGVADMITIISFAS